jgi:hypothetical protein
VIIDFLEWAARRRVAVLIAVVPATVVLQVLLQRLEDKYAWRVVLALSTLLPLVLLLGSAFAARKFHPARLVARPGVPAFDIPANPGAVLGAAGYTFLGAQVVGMLLNGVVTDEDLWIGAGPVLIWAGLLVAFWISAFGRFGVRLLPHGVLDRQVLGSLFVPWEALAVPYPAYPYDAQRITLFLANPELVHRRGLRVGGPASLPAVGVDAELLARAIHEYANRPDLRPAIGSEAELARFRAIPQIVGLAKARQTTS